MSVYGPILTTTIASAGTSTDEIDLVHSYDFIQVSLPALDSCTIKIQTSFVTGGAFQDLGIDTLATVPTTGERNSTFMIGGWQFIKIVVSAAQSAGRTITLRGGRY